MDLKRFIMSRFGNTACGGRPTAPHPPAPLSDRQPAGSGRAYSTVHSKNSCAASTVRQTSVTVPFPLVSAGWGSEERTCAAGGSRIAWT